MLNPPSWPSFEVYAHRKRTVRLWLIVRRKKPTQGAPNIAKFLPAANAIVDYRALGSPAALRLELQRLNGDARAWEAKVGCANPCRILAPSPQRPNTTACLAQLPRAEARPLAAARCLGKNCRNDLQKLSCRRRWPGMPSRCPRSRRVSGGWRGWSAPATRSASCARGWWTGASTTRARRCALRLGIGYS